MVSIGQKLKDARIRRKLSIEEVATVTKIKPQFLEAIEKEEYNKLPSSAYAQGFVKNYADFLGLPKAQTAAIFKRDYDEEKITKILPDRMSTEENFNEKKINIRVITLGLLIFFLLFIFLFFQVRKNYIAPSIFISTPKEGSIVTTELDIIGKTDRNAILTVNDESVFIQENGEFKKKIILFPGSASIVVKARNRAGRETILKRNVIAK